MMKQRILAAASLALWVGATALTAQESDTTNQKAVDQALVAEIEQAVTSHLSRIQPDDPICERYGKFLELNGADYRRGSGFKTGGYISLSRVAVFEKATVELPITVSSRGRLSLKLQMSPSAEWMAKNPQASIVKSGDDLVMQAPGLRVATSLEIYATHPKFYLNAADRRRSEELHQSVDQAVSDLAASVTERDPSRRTAARQWYLSQKSAKPIDLFIEKALAHRDRRVRLEAVTLLSLPSPGYGKVLHADSTIELLLDTLESPDQSEKLKLEIVSAIMLNYEHNRKPLYRRLEEMGVDGQFAIPVLAAFLNDSTARHYSSGGAFDAPIGAVELLGDWGADAADAVPDLVAALEKHPNQWNLAPAAADALGKIGPAAESAIPALRRASSSSRGNVRRAAAAAMEKIDVNEPQDPSDD